MQSFVIEGGRALSGTVRAAGNKNAALPILAASLLASDEVRLSNVPRIRDVGTMVELLVDIGADAEWTGPNEIRIDPVGVDKTDLDPDLCREIRASFLLAGPLLSRFGRVTGATAGRRRDRAQAAGYAHPCVSGARRRRRAERRVRDEDERSPWQAHLPRRGLGHGHRERDHGGDACRGRDRGRPCRVRAPHPGPLPVPRLARGANRGHRLQRAPHPGRRLTRRRRAPDRAGARRGRELRGARRPHRRRRHDRGCRARRPDRHHPGVPQARDPDGGRGARRSRLARTEPASGRRSRWADSRRSRVGSGRRSPPT